MNIVARQSLLTASAVLMAGILAFSLALPEPYWACITAWVIANPDRGATVSKAAMRLVGTFAGCVTGYVLAVLTMDDPFVMVMCMAAVVGLGAYRRFQSPYPYAWALFYLTTAMALAANVSDPADVFQFVVSRGLEVTVGVVAYFVVETAAGRLVPQAEHPGEPAKISATDLVEVEHAAIVSSLTCVVAIVAWIWFDLPSILQIIVSAVILVDQKMTTMITRSWQRLLGCLVGAGVGIPIAMLGIETLPAWSILLLGGLFLFAQIHHGDPRVAYIGTQAGFAYIMALVTGPAPAATILPAVERLVGMTSGVVILLLVVIALHPWLVARHRAVSTKGAALA
ncbi:putative membrane protein YccC [Rhodoligotrophos appendicifer]|uniref:FUSC family protein n=1 Tax=Rhodoligotrophos appendicifer TaxID=987056 RepID=UPI00117E34C6|nr:FUSC family protein [Rhodoligotrophos appendicifer]